MIARRNLAEILKLSLIALLLTAFYLYSNQEQKSYFFSGALAKTKAHRKNLKKVRKNNIQKKSAFLLPLKIIGNDVCTRQTLIALDILQRKSNRDYEKVINSIGIIECSESGSGIFVLENPARFRVGQPTFQSDENWYASVLVHESCHVQQHRSYSILHPLERVPTEIFSGPRAESECLSAQYETLSRLKAKQSLLDYVKKIAQTNYWDIPPEKRWW